MNFVPFISEKLVKHIFHILRWWRGGECQGGVWPDLSDRMENKAAPKCGLLKCLITSHLSPLAFNMWNIFSIWSTHNIWNMLNTFHIFNLWNMHTWCRWCSLFQTCPCYGFSLSVNGFDVVLCLPALGFLNSSIWCRDLREASYVTQPLL